MYREIPGTSVLRSASNVYTCNNSHGKLLNRLENFQTQVHVLAYSKNNAHQSTLKNLRH